MPRTAATILGLLLVALSIGFNTVRYPEVWEMVNPIRASETPPSAAASMPEKPSSAPPQLAVPSPPPKPIEVKPPKPIEVKPTPAVAEKAAVEQPGVEQKKAAGNEPAADQEVRKPLVPVTTVPAGSPDSGVADGAGIRRLPPVDPNNANLANRDPLQSANGSIPIYPTTGIE